MTLNTSKREEVARRRLWVGRLRARGLTMREIVEYLPQLREAIVRRDGSAYSLGTIHGDCKALDKEWHDFAIQAIDEHKKRLLSEINEVKRRAHEAKDLRAVLAAMQQEASLLGTDAPRKIAPTNPTGESEYHPVDYSKLASLSAEQLAALAGAAKALTEGD